MWWKICISATHDVVFPILDWSQFIPEDLTPCWICVVGARMLYNQGGREFNRMGGRTVDNRLKLSHSIVRLGFSWLSPDACLHSSSLSGIHIFRRISDSKGNLVGWWSSIGISPPNHVRAFFGPYLLKRNAVSVQAFVIILGPVVKARLVARQAAQGYCTLVWCNIGNWMKKVFSPYFVTSCFLR